VVLLFAKAKEPAAHIAPKIGVIFGRFRARLVRAAGERGCGNRKAAIFWEIQLLRTMKRLHGSLQMLLATQQVDPKDQESPIGASLT
jgi:hypothetical protein